MKSNINVDTPVNSLDSGLKIPIWIAVQNRTYYELKLIVGYLSTSTNYLSFTL